MSKTPRQEWTNRIIVLALVACASLLLWPYVTGLIGAGVLYVIARPLMDRVPQRLPHRPAAGVIILVLLVFIVVPAAWLLAELLAQAPEALRRMQNSAQARQLQALRVSNLELGSVVATITAEVVTWSSRQTMAAVGQALGATLNLVIALFGAYYLLLSADRIWDTVRRMLPMSPATIEALRVRFHHTTEAMLLGVVLTAVAQGTIVATAFWALGFRQPLLWGVVTAFASVLPMFGSALVWLPASLFLLSDGRFIAAATLAMLGALVVSNIDNALRLVVYRRVSAIHPMVTLVGAFAGVRAFGLAGVLIGPLLLSYMIELIKLQPRAPAFVPEVAA